MKEEEKRMKEEEKKEAELEDKRRKDEYKRKLEDDKRQFELDEKLRRDEEKRRKEDEKLQLARDKQQIELEEKRRKDETKSRKEEEKRRKEEDKIRLAREKLDADIEEKKWKEEDRRRKLEDKYDTEHDKKQIELESKREKEEEKRLKEEERRQKHEEKRQREKEKHEAAIAEKRRLAEEKKRKEEEKRARHENKKLMKAHLEAEGGSRMSAQNSDCASRFDAASAISDGDSAMNETIISAGASSKKSWKQTLGLSSSSRQRRNSAVSLKPQESDMSREQSSWTAEDGTGSEYGGKKKSGWAKTFGFSKKTKPSMRPSKSGDPFPLGVDIAESSHDAPYRKSTSDGTLDYDACPPVYLLGPPDEPQSVSPRSEPIFRSSSLPHEDVDNPPLTKHTTPPPSPSPPNIPPVVLTPASDNQPITVSADDGSPRFGYDTTSSAADLNALHDLIPDLDATEYDSGGGGLLLDGGRRGGSGASFGTPPVLSDADVSSKSMYNDIDDAPSMHQPVMTTIDEHIDTPHTHDEKPSIIPASKARSFDVKIIPTTPDNHHDMQQVFSAAAPPPSPPPVHASGWDDGEDMTPTCPYRDVLKDHISSILHTFKVPSNLLDTVLLHAFRKRLDPDTVLIRSGDVITDLHFIENGTIGMDDCKISEGEWICADEFEGRSPAPSDAVVGTGGAIVWRLTGSSVHEALKDIRSSLEPDICEMFKSVPILRNLSGHERRLLAESVHIEKFDPSEVIFAQKEMGRKMFLVLEGVCEGLVAPDMTRRTYKAGSNIAHLNLMRPQPYPETLTAGHEKGVVLASLSRAAFSDAIGVEAHDVYSRTSPPALPPGEKCASSMALESAAVESSKEKKKSKGVSKLLKFPKMKKKEKK
eukprot:GHVO01027447.1.p1 GENE.GHVO01027447.1~~GHVO01027447.1.p1  ORF type:complete len:873 (-),score=249.15 GHVO01027447.1:108-2726(-)